MRTYTPKETVEYEALIGWHWRGPRGHEGPVAVTVEVYEGPKQHAGDLDNYVKIALDALNKLAWRDDKQVVRVLGTISRGDSNPRMKISVESLPD